MKLLIVLSVVVLVVAQYGVPQDPPAYQNPGYPAANPSYPILPIWGHRRRHHSSSSDRHSRSRSHSHGSKEKGKKCRDCHKLKNFKDASLENANISYFSDKKNCIRALVGCPFTNTNFTLLALNSMTDSRELSIGEFIQREIKCTRKGKWEADTIPEEDFQFKFVACRAVVAP